MHRIAHRPLGSIFDAVNTSNPYPSAPTVCTRGSFTLEGLPKKASQMPSIVASCAFFPDVSFRNYRNRPSKEKRFRNISQQNGDESNYRDRLVRTDYSMRRTANGLLCAAWNDLSRSESRVRARSDFERPEDYAAFEKVLSETQEQVLMRVLSDCLMPKHWHPSRTNISGTESPFRFGIKARGNHE